MMAFGGRASFAKASLWAIERFVSKGVDIRTQRRSADRWWWTWATLRILDIGARALCQLLEKKRTLNALLLDGALDPLDTDASCLIVGLDFVEALL
jgi:hypothetical protein